MKATKLGSYLKSSFLPQGKMQSAVRQNEADNQRERQRGNLIDS